MIRNISFWIWFHFLFQDHLNHHDKCIATGYNRNYICFFICSRYNFSKWHFHFFYAILQQLFSNKAETLNTLLRVESSRVQSVMILFETIEYTIIIFFTISIASKFILEKSGTLKALLWICSFNIDKCISTISKAPCYHTIFLNHQNTTILPLSKEKAAMLLPTKYILFFSKVMKWFSSRFKLLQCILDWQVQPCYFSKNTLLWLELTEPISIYFLRIIRCFHYL